MNATELERKMESADVMVTITKPSQNIDLVQGCGFVYDSYMAYIAIHLAGVHTGKVILRLVEAVGKLRNPYSMEYSTVFSEKNYH